jgi:hypothetical protein
VACIILFDFHLPINFNFAVVHSANGKKKEKHVFQVLLKMKQERKNLCNYEQSKEEKV